MVSVVSSHVSVLALALTSCLTICRLRRLYTGGRKARERARRLCHCLPPVLQSALARSGEADLCQALELFGFVLLQARCIQDPFPSSGSGPDGLSFVYQLGSLGLYIGQGALVRGTSSVSGGVGRFREHLRGLRCLSQGIPTKERSRYLHLAPGCQKWLLMLFVALAPTPRVHALESAHIAYIRPEANNLANPHLGRLRARYRSHPRARRRRAQHRAHIPA